MNQHPITTTDDLDRTGRIDGDDTAGFFTPVPIPGALPVTLSPLTALQIQAALRGGLLQSAAVKEIAR